MKYRSTEAVILYRKVYTIKMQRNHASKVPFKLIVTNKPITLVWTC